MAERSTLHFQGTSQTTAGDRRAKRPPNEETKAALLATMCLSKAVQKPLSSGAQPPVKRAKEASNGRAAATVAARTTISLNSAKASCAQVRFPQMPRKLLLPPPQRRPTTTTAAVHL